MRDLLDLSEQRIETMFRGRPVAEAAVRSLVGGAQLQLGELERAEAQLQKAYAIQTGLPDTPRLDRYATLEALIRVLVLRHGRTAAEPFLQEAVNLAVEICGTRQPALRSG